MKLPSLFPVAFFAGGILLSIELKRFALTNFRILIFASLLLLVFGYLALRQRWVLAAALFAAGARRVVVVSGILQAADIAKYCSDLKSEIIKLKS